MPQPTGRKTEAIGPRSIVCNDLNAVAMEQDAVGIFGKMPGVETNRFMAPIRRRNGSTGQR
jgi:hypothetical protein